MGRGVNDDDRDKIGRTGLVARMLLSVVGFAALLALSYLFG